MNSTFFEISLFVLFCYSVMVNESKENIRASCCFSAIKKKIIIIIIVALLSSSNFPMKLICWEELCSFLMINQY